MNCSILKLRYLLGMSKHKNTINHTLSYLPNLQTWDLHINNLYSNNHFSQRRLIKYAQEKRYYVKIASQIMLKSMAVTILLALKYQNH